MAAEERDDTRAGDWLPSRFGRALGVSLLFAAPLLLGVLARTGIWEPHELERAELGRRLAIHLFGAEQLRLPGVVNHMPTLSDLGSGELGATSVAWGLSTFGMYDWAGRLPMALWALAGVLALYVLLARLLTARTGLAAVLVLCTTPLWFMQARTMLGDAVTMAAFTLCFAGLAGAWLDPGGRGHKLAWLLLGGAGVAAGYLSRGLLIGVAAPALGVGLSYLAWQLSGASHQGEPNKSGSNTAGPSALLSRLAGGGALALGMLAGLAGWWMLRGAGFGYTLVERELGVALTRSAPVQSSFDLTVRQLGHALFPWSALLPFAAGRCLRLPEGVAVAQQDREAAVRLSLLIGAAVAYAVHGLLAPYTGALPFSAVSLLAAIIAVALTDLGRGARGSGAIAAGTLLLVLLLARDLAQLPTRVLSAFGLAEHHYPADFALAEPRLLWALALAFGAGMALLWLDDDGDIEGRWAARGRRERGALKLWLRRRIEQYEQASSQLNNAWRGNLSFGFLLIEAALVGLALTLFIGRRVGWENVTRQPYWVAVIGFNAWWVLPLVIVLTPLSLDAARLLLAWLLRRLRLARASAALLLGVGVGLLGSLVFYPQVAGQLSPRQALASFSRRHGPGEPLGLLGVDHKVARYYAGGESVEALRTVRNAAKWLISDADGPRRWLVVRHDDFADLNAAYREQRGVNVPVVEAEAGFPLLITNRLAADANQNPLAELVLDEPPTRIQHPVEATLDGKLQALGWDVIDEQGRVVRFVVPGRTFTLRFYYRVLSTIRRDYRAFLHVDGSGRRHNGDHEVLKGHYPIGLWRLGDVVVDHYEMVLEPNFLPGEYRIYYGFFSGKSRMPVSRGDHHDNRVQGGTLQVR